MLSPGAEVGKGKGHSTRLLMWELIQQSLYHPVRVGGRGVGVVLHTKAVR